MATVEESGVDRWLVGGGAEHTPESARRLVYTSTGGAEGVGGPSDLVVRPLAIPGQGVRIAVGSCLILSRFVGGSTQTYQAAVFREQTLAIAPNTTNKDRYDLIVMRVEDGFAAGSTWPKPPEGERADEQYIYPRAISGVSATVSKLQDVTGQKDTTGYALARVKVPAMEGTINLAQITNLRKVALPKVQDIVFARPRVGADQTAGQIYLNRRWDEGGELFPGGAGSPNQTWIDVPEWATRMIIDASWFAAWSNKNAGGRFWVEFGEEWKSHTWPNKQQYEFATQQFGFDYPNTTDEKNQMWGLADEVPVPAKIRGRRIAFAFCAGMNVGATRDSVWLKWDGGLALRIRFAERAIGADTL